MVEDLSDGQKYLIMYYFVLAPGEHEGCVGCSYCMGHIPDIHHLESRDTTFAAVAVTPMEEILLYSHTMAWRFLVYSSAKTIQDCSRVLRPS